MLNPKKLVLTALPVAAGVVLIVSQGAWSNAAAKSVKLEGAWMMTVPGTPVRASFNLIPSESSCRRASVAGDFIAGMPPVLYGLPPQYIPEEVTIPYSGDLMMVGRHEAVGTLIWWAMRDTVPGEPTYPFRKVVHIGVSAVTASFTSPDKAQFVNRLIFYDPSADANGDGMPDPGVEPIFTVPPVACEITRITLANLPHGE